MVRRSTTVKRSLLGQTPFPSIMFCRSVSWLICILAIAVISTDYCHSFAITGADTDYVEVDSLGADTDYGVEVDSRGADTDYGVEVDSLGADTDYGVEVDSRGADTEYGVSQFEVVTLGADTDYGVEVDSRGADTEYGVSQFEVVTLESTEEERTDDPEEAAAVDLGALLDAGIGCMVILEAGDTLLVAHSAVLAARSRVLAAMLHPDTLEASSGRLTFADLEGPVLRQLVAYLYTQQVPQIPSMAPQLMIAADKYGLPALRSACERLLVSQLSVETAASAAVFAVKHGFADLRDAAAAFIREHSLAVIASEGWADAMRTNPDELTQVSQLLLAAPETSTPSGADAGATPHSDSSLSSQGPATAAACSSVPPLMRSLSADKLGKWLIEAAKEGSVEELRALLAAGADVGATDEGPREGDMWTALHWAAWEGYEEVVKALVEGGMQVSVRSDQRYTPLQIAAWRGHVAVVRQLLAYGSDPNTTNKWGWTPLHEAASHGYAEVATVLLEAGADKEARTYNRRETALDIAKNENYHFLIDILKSR